MKVSRSSFLLGALGTIGGFALVFATGGLQSPAAARVIERTPWQKPGRNVTFLVTADTHLGYRVAIDPMSPLNPERTTRPIAIERIHEQIIEQMNTMQGNAYPPNVGGTVGEPLGLLVAGDLTDDGRRHEWEQFLRTYEHTDRGGLLHFPVFEAIGNHDRTSGPHISEQVAKRHGGKYYSWDWDDVHVVSLAEAPDDQGMEWLAKDLEEVGTLRPTVLYFHYPLLGPYTSGNWFTPSRYRKKLREALAGYNIVAIFHGHFHGSGHYKWEGYDVYNVGSAKHGSRSFAVVNVKDGQFTVASWNYEHRRWWWWHSKPLDPANEDGVEILEAVMDIPQNERPLIPHPTHDWTIR